ncbi:MAG: hypothetical protein ACXVB0_19995 [Mucilaginibacter sp.]
MKTLILYLKRRFLKAVAFIKSMFGRKRRHLEYTVSEDILFV